VKAIEKVFKHSEKDIYKLIRLSGKVGRGRGIPEMNKEIIEFTILRGMNGGITYTELEFVPYRKVIFFCKLMEEESKKIREEMQNAQKQGKRKRIGK